MFSGIRFLEIPSHPRGRRKTVHVQGRAGLAIGGCSYAVRSQFDVLRDARTGAVQEELKPEMPVSSQDKGCRIHRGVREYALDAAFPVQTDIRSRREGAPRKAAPKTIIRGPCFFVKQQERPDPEGCFFPQNHGVKKVPWKPNSPAASTSPNPREKSSPRRAGFRAAGFPSGGPSAGKTQSAAAHAKTRPIAVDKPLVHGYVSRLLQLAVVGRQIPVRRADRVADPGEIGFLAPGKNGHDGNPDSAFAVRGARVGCPVFSVSPDVSPPAAGGLREPEDPREG